LWQLISPSVPVGAYSYSSALEQVIEAGDVRSEADTAGWIDDLLRDGLARTDLPVLVRVQSAAEKGDGEAVARWCGALLAMRETSELRLGDRGMGEALARLLEDLGVCVPRCKWPLAGAFACAG